MTSSNNEIQKAVEENRLLKAYIAYLEKEIEQLKIAVSIGAEHGH